MTQRRLLLILFAGGIVVAAPFLAGLTHDRDISPVNIMATLTEARQTLDDRRDQLAALARDPAAPAARRDKAAHIYRSAQEVHELTTRFIEAAHVRFPHLALFLRNVSERLDEDFRGIGQIYTQVAGEPPPAATQDDSVDAPRPSQAAARAGHSQTAAAPSPDAAAAPLAGAPGPGGRTGSDPSIERAGSFTAQTGSPAESAGPGSMSRAPVDGAAAGLPASGARPRSPESGDPQSDPQAEVSRLRRRYQRAYQLYVRGSDAELDEAIVAFKEILASRQAFHLARYWLTKALVERQRLAEARDEARLLVDQQPHLTVAQDLLSDIERRLPQSQRAPAQGGASPQAAAPDSPGATLQGGTQHPVQMPDPGLDALVAAPEQAAPADPGASQGGPPLGAAVAQTAVGVVLEGEGIGATGQALDSVSLFYEEIQSDGQSRVLAAWRHAPDVKVGPVRGLDANLLAVAKRWGLRVIHCGAHPESIAEDPACVDGVHGGGGFKRDAHSAAPHNLFVDPARVLAARSADHPPAPSAANWPSIERLESAPEPQGRSSRLVIRGHASGSVAFRYDAATGRYARVLTRAAAQAGTDSPGAGASGPPAVATLVVLTQGGVGRRACTVYIAGTPQRAFLDWATPSPILDELGTPLAIPPGPLWIVDPEGAPGARAAAPVREPPAGKSGAVPPESTSHAFAALPPEPSAQESAALPKLPERDYVDP